jgi:hypothetical protein
VNVNLEASDPSFAGKPAPEEDVRNILSWARERLGVGDDRPWTLISARSKLKKTLFEVEEAGSEKTFRMIGKVSRSDRSRNAFHSLQSVWDAGFRPPSCYRVVQPIAYLEERRLLLQAKAPGTQLLDLIRRGDPRLPEMAGDAARWLVALHNASIAAEPFAGEPQVVERCRAELSEELPEHAERIHHAAGALIEKFGERAGTRRVPSHGDFHPMNVFLTDDRCVTVIDFDTFSAREPASDVAYFLSQSAIMGYLDKGSFERSRALRRTFAAAYEEAAGCRLDERRLGLYIAFAFLQSLHFELAILHTGNTKIAAPWLDSAERCLAGDIEL